MSFDNSLLSRVLRRIATAVSRHPRLFVYPQIILSGLCVVYAVQNLKVDMNRDDLVGGRAGHHQILAKFRHEFPGPDQLVVLVESAHWERNRQFIERLAARLGPQTNLFSDLFYKADLATLGPKGLLLAPTTDLDQMRRSLAEYAPVLREFSQATNLDSLFGLVNRQFRIGQSSTTAQREALVKALPLLERLVVDANQSLSASVPPAPPNLEQFFGAGAGAQPGDYISFQQGRIFLLTIKPRSQAVVPQTIERLRLALQETEREVPGVNAGLTGAQVLDYDEMRQSEWDSTIAAVTALLLCSLIFIVAYREVNRPLKAALCLLIGFGYTLGFATLAVGHLNILSVTFAPMLVGLAIDFGVHFISRYEEEMRQRRTTAEAIQRATVFTGQGIVVGALTTAAAFLAMALTRFRGIREVGIICGGGLLLCLVPMMTTLPVLLMRGRQNERDHQIGPAGRRRFQIQKLWMEHPVLVMTATSLLCAVALTQLRRVYFEYDLLRLQSQSLASVRCERKLIHSVDRSVLFATVMADSPQQAQEYATRIRSLPCVSRVDSVAQYLTASPENKLRQIRLIKGELADTHFAPADRRSPSPAQLSATLWYLTGYLGLAEEAARKDNPQLAVQMNSLRERLSMFRRRLVSGDPQIPGRLAQFQQAFFTDLSRAIRKLQTQDTSGRMLPQDLPKVFRDQFVGVTGKYLLRVYPKQDLWRHASQLELMQQLDSVVPSNIVTGAPIRMYENTTLLQHSYQQAAWYALGAITLMLFFHFRTLGGVVLALLPVAIGSLWLLGFMGAFDIPFNPANIMILPLVVGIGVTNGIQILNRFAEEHHADIFATSTGKSVLVSGLTAITGFGALLLAKHQGLKSLGEVMSVGIAACMIAALAILPALLKMMSHRPWATRFIQEQVGFGLVSHLLHSRRS